MPNIYKRKSNKGSWTEDNLASAVTAIQNDSLSIRGASKRFSVPESTLRHRIKNNDFTKRALGPDCQLGFEAEKKLALHIKKLQAVGFAPTQQNVRMLAYNFAETLNKKHTFNKDNKIAGKVWFSSFMRRHPDLSVRKAQGISRARTEGMNREEVKDYFDLLTSILTENELLDKPNCIWNCDEIGVQLNNEPGKVIAEKGSRDVHVVTSAEKGETVTILACCNAEGQFLPPFCIFKGVYAKSQYIRDAPPGTVVKMRRESAYINSELFMEWLTEHFIPRKTAGKQLLILDGHASHMNCPNMLQMAFDNDIIILCLPSHTTHYLQPLDRVVFKPLKTYFKDACNKMVTARRGTGKISREDFGSLLNSAWSHAATVQLATAAFRATGIHPLNIDMIPDYAYLLSCDQTVPEPAPTVLQPISTSVNNPVTTSENNTSSVIGQPSHSNQLTSFICQPSTSSQSTASSIVTPTKVLQNLSPIPRSLEPSKSKRKQSAMNVTDPKNINDKRMNKEAALKKNRSASKGKKPDNKKRPTTSKLQKNTRLKRKKRLSFEESSTSEEDDLAIELLSDHVSEDNDDECTECLELYHETTSTSDWVKCIMCGRWMHESCTIYEAKCIDCGRLEKRQAKNKK